MRPGPDAGNGVASKCLTWFEQEAGSMRPGPDAGNGVRPCVRCHIGSICAPVCERSPLHLPPAANEGC